MFKRLLLTVFLVLGGLSGNAAYAETPEELVASFPGKYVWTYAVGYGTMMIHSAEIKTGGIVVLYGQYQTTPTPPNVRPAQVPDSNIEIKFDAFPKQGFSLFRRGRNLEGHATFRDWSGEVLLVRMN